MLQDESLEYIREQYDEKNMVLGQFGEQVSAWTMYEDIFSDMEKEVPIVILDEENGKKIRAMPVSAAVDMSACRSDVLMGGCSYFNNWISKKSAKEIYTFIIDMDNVYSGTLLYALQADWASANGEPFAKPTYIVNSGTGLHLYFVLDDAVPCYRRSMEDIDQVYRALAVQQSRRVYVKRQVHWFGQDFRMAGGNGKYGWENTVFRIGEKWDIDELAKAVGVNTHFVRYGEKREQLPREKTKRRKGGKGWYSNRAFYNYSLESCREKTREGNRYTSMCALSVIAWKCNVPMGELERDLRSLLPGYNKGAIRQIKESEIYSAMKMYNEKAMLTQRASLEHWQGWEYKPIKRNGRKRADHLKIMNFVREEINGNKEWRNKNGQPSKRGAVFEYMRSHPEVKKKTEIARALQIDRGTVAKYYDEILQELQVTM